MYVQGGSGMNNLFLMFNTRRKPFDDVRVRQALHYAIDTEKMIEVALKGHGKPATFLPQRGTTRATARRRRVYDVRPGQGEGAAGGGRGAAA